MTFWHYHWALLRARELELRTAIAFPFAHMAQLATPDGACSYSIASMAADLGLDRRDFGRAVRELWKRGALYAAGKSSRGRSATVYRLLPELEARAIVEAWRAARRQPGPTAPDERQPGPGAPVRPDQPGPTAPVDRQPGPTAPDQPGPTAPDSAEPSPGEQSYRPRLRANIATGAHSPGSAAQPGPTAPQPGPTAPHYKSTILIHESERRPADSWKDWRRRQASP